MKIFLGRPDGIGNRVEEIIRLANMHPRETIYYIWNNSGAIQARSYPALIFHRNVYILTAPSMHWLGLRASNVIRLIANLLHNTLKCDIPVDRVRICESARAIRPKFVVSLDTIEPVLGLHLRGGDRIDPQSSASDHFMKTRDELMELVNKSLAYIKISKISSILVCADEPALRSYAESAISAMGKRVVHPIANTKVHKDFLDFFALTLCKEIVIATKFSSFSLTAALVGDIAIKHFGTPQHLIDRYGVRQVSDEQQT